MTFPTFKSNVALLFSFLVFSPNCFTFLLRSSVIITCFLFLHELDAKEAYGGEGLTIMLYRAYRLYFPWFIGVKDHIDTNF